MADIFDRIAGAIVLLASGIPATDPTVVAHLKAIDDHLTNDDAHDAAVDAHLATLDGDATDETARIAVIETGLQKIADAVAPAAPADPVTAPAIDPASVNDAVSPPAPSDTSLNA